MLVPLTKHREFQDRRSFRQTLCYHLKRLGAKSRLLLLLRALELLDLKSEALELLRDHRQPFEPPLRHQPRYALEACNN